MNGREFGAAPALPKASIPAVRPRARSILFPPSPLRLPIHGDLSEQNPECSGNSRSLFASDKGIFVVPSCEIHFRSEDGADPVSSQLVRGMEGDFSGSRRWRACSPTTLCLQLDALELTLWNGNVEPHFSGAATSVNITFHSITLSHTQKAINTQRWHIYWETGSLCNAGGRDGSC